jgi:hypothetical protein
MWFFRWIRDWLKSWSKPAITYPKEKPYEFKYPLDTPKETIVESVENLLNKRVEEVTPEGKVLLTYDEPSKTFFYWAEKPIAYRYLEVVSRKYVILYECKENYINMFRELLKAMQAKKEEEKDSPFAKFKSYNTVAHKLNNNKLVNETGNQYKHVGKQLETVVKKNVKPISFTDYKKIIDTVQ